MGDCTAVADGGQLSERTIAERTGGLATDYTFNVVCHLFSLTHSKLGGQRAGLAIIRIDYCRAVTDRPDRFQTLH